MSSADGHTMFLLGLAGMHRQDIADIFKVSKPTVYRHINKEVIANNYVTVMSSDTPTK